MPVPRLEKFDTFESACRVLGETFDQGDGWYQTDKGTYLVDSSDGFVKVQVWEVNAIYSMLNLIVGDQRLLIKLAAKVRELRSLSVEPVDEFAITATHINVRNRLEQSICSVEQQLKKVYDERVC